MNQRKYNLDLAAMIELLYFEGLSFREAVENVKRTIRVVPRRTIEWRSAKTEN